MIIFNFICNSCYNYAAFPYITHHFPNTRIWLQPVGPFAMNQYILWCKKTRKAAIIDSGANPDAFQQYANKHRLEITHLLQVWSTTMIYIIFCIRSSLISIWCSWSLQLFGFVDILLCTLYLLYNCFYKTHGHVDHVAGLKETKEVCRLLSSNAAIERHCTNWNAVGTSKRKDILAPKRASAVLWCVRSLMIHSLL